MDKPIEPTPVLKGKDAETFLKEKKRVENLRDSDKESRDGARFRKKCTRVYKSNPW